MDNEIKIKLLPLVGHILSNIRRDILFTFLLGVLGFLISFNIEEEFISRIDLVSSEDDTSVEGSLSSFLPFQSIAQSSTQIKKPIKILSSSPFLSDFVKYHSLDSNILNKGYDDSDLDDVSGIAALMRDKQASYNEQSIKALAFSLSSKLTITDNSPFVTVELNSYSPYVSKILLEELIKFLNLRMKQKAILESQLEIDFLTKEMQKVKISDIKSSFSQVIQKAITTSSLANMKDDYIFETIEPASINTVPDSPNRQIIFITYYLL